jgi:hypothetical protein
MALRQMHRYSWNMSMDTDATTLEAIYDTPRQEKLFIILRALESFWILLPTLSSIS